MVLDLDALWKSYTEATGVYDRRPDFRFDAVHYLKAYTEVADASLDALEHFQNYGKAEGRAGTLYQLVRQTHLDLDSLIAAILLPSELKDAVLAEQPDAAKLAYELMLLQGDIDERISEFSKRHYEIQYPDVKLANIAPLRHYLEFGRREGRISLANIRRNFFEGDRPYDPAKKTIIIGVHEFTTTGAPIVGLELVRQAAERFNVIVLSLVDGPLLETFRREAMCVFISFLPHEEIDFVLGAQMPTVEYALLNSADTSPFIKMLVGRGVPFGVYVHEYSQYSLPLHKTIFPSFYADFMIFSSENVRISWRGMHSDLGFDTDSCSTVIPQAELVTGMVTRTNYLAARERISKLIGQDLGHRKLVYGAGSVHWRKGTDLFILTAQMAHKRDPDAVFIWIGDGLNHEDFNSGVWLEKQMSEAQVNQPGSYFYFLPGGSYYRDLCIAADVMVLLSRMDPLPNVVFDAVKCDNDVVLFENASGFDDDAYASVPQLHKVGYGMLDEAADLTVALGRKVDRVLAVAEPEPDQSEPRGPNLFERVAGALESHLALRRHFYLGTGDYDLPVLFSEREIDKPFRKIERCKAWSNGRRTVWKSDSEAAGILAKSDHPVHRNSSILKYSANLPRDVPSFSMHVHAFYTFDLEHDLHAYLAFKLANRIVITTDSEKKSNAINSILKGLGGRAEIVVISNQGRDILPFMNLFREITKYGDDDVWGHVHQKKSLSSTPGGDVWRAFMLTNLLGKDDMISNAVTAMNDPQVGLVAPFDPYICGWFGSKRILPIYQPLVKTTFPDHPILFSVGNMFWTRKAVVAQMNSYFGLDFAWPNEPIANDGTVFHLIERLWPTATFESGLKSVFISKVDQPRR